MVQFKGICKSQFNIIDQAHIDSVNKIIIVTTDLNNIRRIWNNRPGNPICNDGVVIHIRGMSNWSHIIDRIATFNVQIGTGANNTKRFILKSVNLD